MALTQVNGGMLDSVAQQVGFRNRIINGAMMIDQRNAGASVTPANGGYSLDRWGANQYANAGKFTVQQNAGSVTPPAGFSNYLGVTSTSAYSVGNGDIYTIYQSIEGYNIADLAWGTANAKPVTLSFWVQSSLTGTFGGAIQNSASGTTDCYVFTYTISAANTWEYKTITVVGPTSGTWQTTNGIGICVRFGLGGGSFFSSSTTGSWLYGSYYYTATGATSVVGTNGATFYITGVQLEKGSTATSFDYRPYGTELALCQRYYEALSAASGTNVSAGSFIALGVCETASRVQPYYTFKVQKRTTPSVTISSIGTFGIRSTGSSVACTSGNFGGATPVYAQGEFNNGGGGLIAGGCGWLVNQDGNAKLEWSAEL